MDESFHIYHPRALPHWRLSGATYFATWNLAASQPAMPHAERQTILESITLFDGVRYEIHAFVVMDDHVHAVVYPLAGWSLQQIIHDWKSFTAHMLARGGRKTPVWQKDYYDRILRDEDELLEKISYVVGNPQRRWPDVTGYAWVYPDCSVGLDR